MPVRAIHSAPPARGADTPAFDSGTSARHDGYWMRRVRCRLRVVLRAGPLSPLPQGRQRLAGEECLGVTSRLIPKGSKHGVIDFESVKNRAESASNSGQWVTRKLRVETSIV